MEISNNQNLTELICAENQLTELDISNNLNLTELDFSGNQLTSMDVSNHTELLRLICGNNQLPDLNVSNNAKLEILSCGGNLFTSVDLSHNPNLLRFAFNSGQLTSLDLSNCPALNFLFLDNNPLTELDLRNGTNMSSGLNPSIRGSPDLTCIAVDDPAWSTANWTRISPESSYSDNCNDLGLTDTETDNCYLAASIDISTAQGNNNGYLPVLDANGKLVCDINARGNDLGVTDFYVYRSSTDRTDVGVPYMRRDVEISPTNQPSSPVEVVIYYTAAELAALVAADPTVTDESDLGFAKSDASCSGAISGAVELLPQQSSGKYGLNGDVYVITKVSSFSTFYPNPSSGSINIQLNNPEGLKTSLRVVDQLGRTVWENNSAANTSSGRFELDVEKSGLYFISTQVGEETYTQRMVVFN